MKLSEVDRADYPPVIGTIEEVFFDLDTGHPTVYEVPIIGTLEVKDHLFAEILDIDQFKNPPCMAGDWDDGLPFGEIKLTHIGTGARATGWGSPTEVQLELNSKLNSYDIDQQIEKRTKEWPKVRGTVKPLETVVTK